MIMTIGERIFQLRQTNQLSQAELAKIAGVTDKAVSTWEIGAKRPRVAVIKRIVAHFGLPEDDWLYEEETVTPLSKGATNTKVTKTHRVRMFSGDGRTTESGGAIGDTATNPPSVLNNDDLQRLVNAYCTQNSHVQRMVCQALEVEYLEPQPAMDYKTVEMIVYTDPASCGMPLYAESDYDRITLPEMMVAPGADFGVKILGDSMEPTIRNGQIVWVRKQTTLRNQEIGLFILGDSTVCRRLSLPPFARNPKLLSDNPKYPPMEGMDLEDLRVVGRVFL